MLPPFEEAFEALFDTYASEPIDDLISALELKLMALREEAAAMENQRGIDAEQD